MSKAIRMAIAAAFGVATVFPALAQPLDRSEFPQDRYNTYDSRAYRADRYQPPYRLEYSMVDSSNEYGSAAGNMPYDREVHLGANGGNVGVSQGETVKFVTADGREFRWRFDTLKPITSFPLASIAPDRNLQGRVFVNSKSDSGD